MLASRPARSRRARSFPGARGTKEYGWTLPATRPSVCALHHGACVAALGRFGLVSGRVYEPIRVWPTGRTGRLPAYFTTINERYQEQLPAQAPPRLAARVHM